jgi:enterochelin esterase-like enzyme
MTHTFIKFIVLGMLLSCVGIVFNAAQSACTLDTGATNRETYSSNLLGQAMYYTVYTPPCYAASGTPYPVIYLMHGSNDDDEQWLRLGLREELDTRILSGEIPPLVAVLPFGNVIANRNRFDFMSWGNIFREELMPDAEAKYNIATNREQRAIGGVSRGGFWAYQIAFSHPEMFSAVGGHSAFFDLYHAAPEDNPLHLALSQSNIETMRLWLDRGEYDYAQDGLENMAERLTERGLEHTYNVYPVGEHNNLYWSQHVAEYIDFYVAAWLEVPQLQPTPAALNPFATNTPIAAIPTVAPQPTVQSTGLSVFFPAVAFPSLETTISTNTLQNVVDGQLDVRLVLDETTVAAIQNAGLAVHPETRIVAPDMLRDTLWQNRDWYTLLPITALRTDYRVLFVDDLPLIDQLETYPFAVESTNANFDPALLTRITASGVTAPARQTLTAFDNNGLEWAMSGIASYVMSSDYFHMSNEVSAAEQCPALTGETLGGSTSMCTKPAYLDLFTMLDTDIIELTGNHNNDYGYEAYRQTLNFYRDNGIVTVGGGETLAEARTPYLINHNGSTVAWLACNIPGPYYALVNETANSLGGVRPGAAACDSDWLQTAIPELAQQVDVLIVSVQYIEVEDYQPAPNQQYDFQQLADLGADIVLGTAAHKPQIYEFYSDSFIHYGMGNLYFDQPFWGNMRFFMNTFYIYDGKLQGVEIFPGIIDDLGRPRLMTAEERANFLFFMFHEQNRF